MKKYLVITASALAALLTACNRELPVTTFTPLEPSVQDTFWLRNADGSAALDRTIPVDTLFRQSATAYTIDPQSPDTIRGTGWQLTVTPNAFALPGSGSVGSVPITAPITVYVHPVFSKGQFLRQALSTSVSGQRAVAFGVFNIKAVLNNVELVLRQGAEMRITSSVTGLPTNMSLYQLVTTGNSPFSSNWQLPTDTSRLEFTASASPVFYSRKMGTVAGFLPVSSAGQWTAKVTTILPANFTNANTAVYAVHPSQNSLIRLQPDGSNKTFVLPNANTNETLRFIAISQQSGNFYFADGSFSLQGNPIIKLTPSVVSRAQLESTIDAL